jgi:hypothetical protein
MGGSNMATLWVELEEEQDDWGWIYSEDDTDPEEETENNTCPVCGRETRIIGDWEYCSYCGYSN